MNTIESHQQTDIPVGEILRRTRVHYGKAIEDVEESIRIRAHILNALEENDADKLPARVYTLGFVRSYAQYLGLDPDKMVQLYKSQGGDSRQGPELYIPTAEEDNKAPPVWLIIFTILFVCVAVSFWANEWNTQRDNVEQVPPVPTEIQEQAFGTSQETDDKDLAEVKSEISEDTPEMIEEAPVESAASEGVGTEGESEAEAADTDTDTASEAVEIAENSETNSSPAASAENQQMTGILLVIKENSWVEIRDKDGKRIISRVLKSGDRYFVPDRPDLLMSLGNAGGVEIEVDGQALKPLGADAQVKRNIPLDAAFLKENYQ
ncbi:MAG: DUF4115 domain-containing protein [Micavibrio sp.]|nr:DUF4115 domain-containing protein [Micavibrio sp.]